MLTRYEEDNIRWYDVPGLGRVPSATTVLKALSKPALIGWSAKCAAEYMRGVLQSISEGEMSAGDLDKKTIESLVKEAKSQHKKTSTEAADTGSEVHALIEEYYKGMIGVESENIPPSIDPKVLAAMEAFYDWDRKNRVKPLCVEERIWSAELYAGTLDLYAEVGGVPTLVDFKSSTGHWDDHVLQLGAYDMAFRERTGNKIDAYMVVRLDKTTGIPDPKTYSREEVELGGKRFLAILKYWWLTNGAK